MRGTDTSTHISLAATIAGRLEGVADPESLEAALAEVARDLAPAVADLCLIEVAGAARGEGRLVALAHGDADAAERASAARDRSPTELAAVREATLRGAGDHPLAAELGWTACVTAPIRHAGRTAGVLTLAAEGARSLGQEELQLARCVAGLAGLALAGARSAGVRDELLAVVSHDLRNPLGVILLVIDFLRGDALSPTLRTQLGRLERAAQSMSRIITDVVDFGRLGTPSAPLEIDRRAADQSLEAACDAAQAAADEKGVALERRAAPGLELSADHDRLVRALELLVTGAVQRTPSGRSVAVAVDREGDSAVWTVEDGAPASSPAPPRRRIGPLAWVVVQSVVSAHGGDLWLERGASGGVAARFSLPLHPSLPAPPPAVA